MVTLKILGIEKNKYTLLDEQKNELHSLYFEFYGIDKPKINETISFDGKFLDKRWESFAQPYAFEVVKDGKDYDEKNKIEYAVLTTDKKNILLRRIYG